MAIPPPQGSTTTRVDAMMHPVRTPEEERALLDAAVKADDGFFATFFVSPYSKYVARFAARHGRTPNEVTILSFALGLAAASFFSVGSRWASVVAALLVQAAFTADCVDGQLARYGGTFSSLGAWLDSVLDRTKEHLLYAGLAIGAVRGYDEDVWTLAVAAIALLTVRHLADAAYAGGQGEGVRELRAGQRPARVWLARIFRFPIGERFLAISLGAALFTPRLTFLVLLAWGGVATAFTLARRMMVDRPGGMDYALCRDDGPLASRLLARIEPHWLSVPIVLGIEYGFIAALVALADHDALPACFAFLAVVAFHQYDAIHRPRTERSAAPGWMRVITGGWEGRMLLVAVFALAGVLRIGLAVAAAAFAVLFAAETILSWTRIGDRTQPGLAGRDVGVEDAG